MKNTVRNLAGSFRRRSFFVAAIGAVAGAWTGPALIRRLLSSGTPHDEKHTAISVTINPLAVPRTTKGENRHG